MKSAHDLTPRQFEVLEFIRQSVRERGFPPTLREIGNHMGIRSTNGVNDHLRVLQSKGYLTRLDLKKSRALRLTPRAAIQGELPLGDEPTGSLANRSANDGAALEDSMTAPRAIDDATMSKPSQSASFDEVVEVKILGRVAAGLPVLAEEHHIDTVRIDRGMLNVSAQGAKEVFGLRVSGESMIEAGILHGDYLFVKRTERAERGQIVVAMIGDEATVKYYYPERDHIRFQPANAQMAPIYVRASDFRPTMLLGVVVGIYRRF